MPSVAGPRRRLARAALGLMAALLMGCPKAAPEPAATWADTPRLPSPSAGSYARAPAEPTDPPLVELMRDHRWDASLAGGAASVALRASRGLDSPPWYVRHAGWKAGYPYPIDTLSLWRTGNGAPPPPGLLDWLDARTDAHDIGLVRARGDGQDVWVALTAQPRASIGVQPRQLPVGAAFTLPRQPGATFEVADGQGRVRNGRLDLAQTFTVDIAGEWVVKVEQEGKVVAWFPVYVDRQPPAEPIVATEVQGPLVDRVEKLLDHVRDAQGLGELQTDLLFQAAANRLLSDPAMSSDTLASRVGWDPKRLARWDVRAATLAAAMDRVIWEPAARPALLADSGHVGLAAEATEAGVHIVVLIGSE